jgi:BioD-like phosphotransacetylase family protein
MALYVASWGMAAGKTALCATIGRWLQRSGRKTGYLKPVVIANGGVDKDVQFLKQALVLGESVEALSPLHLSDWQSLKTELSGGALGAKVKQSYDKVVQGKDAVLLEGFGDLAEGGHGADAALQIVEALNARVVLVVAYAIDLPWNSIVSSAQRFGQHLLGIVISMVPQNKMESVQTEVASRLNQKGIKILGLVPDERLLFGVSVAEIAEQLQADILCCPEGSMQLVENVMMGALTPDSGEEYFKRKTAKAVVVRGERPDMQLAALSTPTKCLILTGGVAPIPQVLGWAEDKGVTILLAKQDTLSTVAEVEKAFTQARFRHPKKLDRMERLLKERFDLQSIGQVLGLAS